MLHQEFKVDELTVRVLLQKLEAENFMGSKTIKIFCIIIYKISLEAPSQSITIKITFKFAFQRHLISRRKK